MKIPPLFFYTYTQSADQIAPNSAGEAEQVRLVFDPAVRSGSLAIQVQQYEDHAKDQLLEQLVKHSAELLLFHLSDLERSDVPSAVDPSGLIEKIAALLISLPNLKLTFLNCVCTQEQKKEFLRQGIPALLATSGHIPVEEASNFAIQFYRAVAGRNTLLNAFQLAVAALKSRYEHYRFLPVPSVKTISSTAWSEIEIKECFPWQLYVQQGQEQTLNWFLPYPRILASWPSIDLETECLGREKELNELRSLLESSSKVVLVSGMGGMGKTTLAAAYLQEMNAQYDHLAWIHNGDELLNAFSLNVELATALELPLVEGENLEDRFARLMNKLRNLPGHNLLVIDDANAQVQALETYLPQGSNWQVLLTSRLVLPEFREMKLGALRPGDALLLFRLHYQGSNDEAVEMLLQEVNYHPLSIEVMAKTLNRLKERLSVPELIRILKERQLDDPALQELIYTRHAEEERAIFFHLMKAFELARLSEQEIWLMQQYAVLPSMAIEVKTLADLVQEPPLSLNRQVNNLYDQGWISKQGKGLTMHRIIQEVVKYHRPPTETILSPLLNSLTTRLRQQGVNNPVLVNFPWVPYGKTLAAYFENHPGSSTLAGFWNNYGTMLRELGQYQEALACLQKAMLTTPVDEELNLATRQGNVAAVLGDLGDNAAAIPLYESALQTEERLLGETSPSVWTTRSNLALRYAEEGQVETAAQLLNAILRIALNEGESPDPIVPTLLSNLAAILQTAEQKELALQLQTQALQLAEKIYPPQHPQLGVLQNNLATSYRFFQRKEEALALLQSALSKAEEHFEQHHPTLAAKRANLALVLQDMGRHNEALPYLEQALESDLANFGFQHLNVALSRWNLASGYYYLGRYPEAVELLELARGWMLSWLPNEHPYHAHIAQTIRVVQERMEAPDQH